MKLYYTDNKQIEVRFDNTCMFNPFGLSTFRVIVPLAHVLTGASEMYCQKQIVM